jgi:hypothetical protein
MAQKSSTDLLTTVAKSVGSAIGTIANRVRTPQRPEVDKAESAAAKPPVARVSRPRRKKPTAVTAKRTSKKTKPAARKQVRHGPKS